MVSKGWDLPMRTTLCVCQNGNSQELEEVVVFAEET